MNWFPSLKTYNWICLPPLPTLYSTHLKFLPSSCIVNSYPNIARLFSFQQNNSSPLVCPSNLRISNLPSCSLWLPATSLPFEHNPFLKTIRIPAQPELLLPILLHVPFLITFSVCFLEDRPKQTVTIWAMGQSSAPAPAPAGVWQGSNFPKDDLVHKAGRESALCPCGKKGHEGGQILEWVAQGRCKISILAGNQNPAVQELEQPDVRWPCFEQGVVADDLRGSFQTILSHYSTAVLLLW